MSYITEKLIQSFFGDNNYIDQMNTSIILPWTGETDAAPINGDPNDFKPIIVGSDLDEVIVSRGGSVMIGGSGGDDYIVTGGGMDELFGGSGNDTLRSGSGDDEIKGESGRDQLWAGAGNDYAHGGTGNDMVHGGDGNDIVMGGLGNDWVAGGDGDDHVYGNQGNDILGGGSGADTFHFAERSGSDRIVDFDVAEDMLFFDNGANGMDDLRIMQVGEDTVVRYADSEIWLDDVDASTLEADGMFLF